MKIAIAGANSGVGRHIAERLLTQTKHSLLVLSRRPNADLERQGAQVLVADFSSVESLATLLEGVHTFINTIGLYDHSIFSSTELALIQASEKAGVRRFIASGWSGKAGEADKTIEIYHVKQASVEALRQSTMEWTYPEVGLFLNYLAVPKAGLGYLKPAVFHIDMAKGQADIPGDGNQKMVWTRMEDVAEFIEKLLEVDHWPQHLRIVGNLISLNDLVKLGEQATGKFFEVKYHSEESLQKAIDPNPDSPFTNVLPQSRLAVLRGDFTFEPNFNAEVPVKFTTAEEFLKKWWGADSPALE